MARPTITHSLFASSFKVFCYQWKKNKQFSGVPDASVGRKNSQIRGTLTELQEDIALCLMGMEMPSFCSLSLLTRQH